MFRKRPPAVSSSLQPSGSSGTSQRRYVRAQVDLSVTYVLEEREGARTGRIDNLSEGGVRLETDEDLAAGTALRLDFATGDVSLTPAGRVVMSFFDGGRQRFLHGIAFTAIEPAQQAAITALVSEREGGNAT